MDEKTMIRNRDILKLQSVYALMQEIVSMERRRDYVRDRLNNVTTHLGSTGGGGVPKGMEETFAALSGIEDEHEKALKRFRAELMEAQNMLNGLPSSGMRAFVTMKYLDNYPDRDVRESLNMTRYYFDEAKRAVEQAESMEQVEWREKYVIIEGENEENSQNSEKN